MRIKLVGKNKNNIGISTAYFFSFTILTIFSICLIGSLWIIKEIRDFKRNSENKKNEFILQQKQVLINKTQECINLIDYQNSIKDSLIRLKLNKSIDQATLIVNTISKCRNVYSLPEIRRRIKLALKDIPSIQHVSNIVIYNKRNKRFVTPEGNIARLCATAETWVQNQILLKKNMPDDYYCRDTIIYRESSMDKVCCLRYFKEVDIFVGCTIFIKAYQEEIKNKCLKRIAALTTSSKNYFFIYNKNGTCLYHADSLSVGRNYKDFYNSERRANIERLITCATRDQEGFISYPDLNSKIGTKISYVQYYPEWKWVIGSGVYTNKIDQEILKAKKHLYKGVRRYIIQIIAITLIAIIVLYFVSRFITNRMNANFFSLNNFLRKASTQSNMIDIQSVHFKEFQLLASTVNKMIKIRSQKEKELLEARHKAEESDRLKSSFLANMSHEIRTPMNAIIGFSELLQEDDLPEETKQLFFKHIKNSGNSLLNLINDIIDFSKIESGELKISKTTFCINQLIDELQLTFEKIKNAKDKQNLELVFIKGLANEESVVYSDPLRLKQILSNLIDNAIKFTDEGKIEILYQLAGKQLIFSIKDTGIGISEENQKIIFSRFRQADDSHARRYGGTGLGLSISKKLAHLLDGNLWLESKINNGSCFYVNIPFSKGNIKNERDFIPVITNISDLFGRKVLLVDDFETNLSLVSKMLESTGVDLYTAKDGMSALEICRNNKIEMVLLDLQMPKINGFDTRDMIKKEYPKINIIAQTAYAQASERKEIIDYGFDGFIAKPIIRKELIELMTRIVNQNKANIENYSFHN